MTATTTDRQDVRLGIGRVALLVAVVSGGVLADLGTKQWALEALADEPVPVLGPFHLTLSFNTGVAFSLGQSVPAAALALLGALIAVAVAVASARGTLPTVPAGLIVGGAVSNVLDRTLDGRVTDFLDVGRWPTFNFADCLIVVGAALLLVTNTRSESEPKAAGAPQQAPLPSHGPGPDPGSRGTSG